MSDFVVAKYGGTSMAQPELVAEIVTSRPDQEIIVVSAPGTSDEYPVKMTDQLKALGSSLANGDTAIAHEVSNQVIDRFASIYAHFGGDVARAAKQTAKEHFAHLSVRNSAHVMALGEMVSAICFADAVNATPVLPEWIRFAPDGALIPGVGHRHKLISQMNQNGRLVVPGFFGYDDHGQVHVLARGGSDRTGAKAARLLGLEFGDDNVIYENWTDVNGILSGHPKIVNSPRTIPVLTHREVREGAHGGTGVLQGDTIVDLDGSTIPVNVRNTLDPTHPGSWVHVQRDSAEGDAIIAVTGRDDIVEVTIDDMGMAAPEGYVARVTSLLGQMGLSLEHMPTAQDAFSLTIHNSGDEAERTERMHRIGMFVEQVEQSALSPNASVTVNERGVVYMIGEQLRDPRKLTNAKIRALGTANQKDATIYEDVSLASSPSIALLTDREKVNPLIRAIHASEIEKSVDLFGVSRNL